MPVLLAELVLGSPTVEGWALAWGPVAAGLALRAWGVGHLGSRSRTRQSGAWELVDTGPFARVRNPLYLGNGLMWLGVGAAAGPMWLAVWAVFGALHYPLVVAWEEANLTAALGEPYRGYLDRVPRWLPRVGRGSVGEWSATEVLRGERSTWLATVAVMGALFLCI